MPNFVSFAASIAELAHGEKSRTQSLTQSRSLFDASLVEVIMTEDNLRITKDDRDVHGSDQSAGRVRLDQTDQVDFCKFQRIGSGRVGRVKSSRNLFLSAGKFIHLQWSNNLSMLTHPCAVYFHNVYL